MKLLDRIILVLFSMVILIVAIVMCLLLFDIVNFSVITNFYTQLVANKVATNVTIGISVLCILFAIKAIFFGSTSDNNKMNGNGVLLENESGKLLISRETIENLVNGVAKGFENTQSVTTKVAVDNENSLTVFVTLMVLPNTVISELSANLQNRIKEVVKNVIDLDIKSIDIKIKNITAPEEKKEE